MLAREGSFLPNVPPEVNQGNGLTWEDSCPVACQKRTKAIEAQEDTGGLFKS